MFKPERVSESILEQMAQNYYKNAFDKAQTNQDHVKIMEQLNSAAELLEDTGLYKEAETVTGLIEVMAKKKKDKDKEDKKDKKKSKKEGESPKDSDEAVENLKTKGWMFSADDGSVIVSEEADDDFMDELKKLWG